MTKISYYLDLSLIELNTLKVLKIDVSYLGTIRLPHTIHFKLQGYMTNISNNQHSLKRYTRWVLVLFVLSVMNMSMQIPAHAAMQMTMQDMNMSHMNISNGVMDHSNMVGMDMQSCECPSVMCDAVDAQQHQLNQNISSATQLDSIAFYATLLPYQKDQLQQRSVQLFQRHDWQYRQSSPHPLSIKTTLTI